MFFLTRPVRWFLTRSLTRYRNVDVVFCVARRVSKYHKRLVRYVRMFHLRVCYASNGKLYVFFFLTSFKRDFILTVIPFVVYARYAHTFTTDLMAFRSVAVACFAVPSYCCVYNVFFSFFLCLLYAWNCAHSFFQKNIVFMFCFAVIDGSCGVTFATYKQCTEHIRIL